LRTLIGGRFLAMLFSVRNHLGDLLWVGFAKCRLRQPSVLPQCLRGPQMVHRPAGLNSAPRMCIDHVTQNQLQIVEGDLSRANEYLRAFDREDNAMNIPANCTPARLLAAVRAVAGAAAHVSCAVGNLRIAHSEELSARR